VLEGQGVASDLHRAHGLHAGEEPLGAGGVDFIGDPAGDELGEQGMKPARSPVPSPTQIGVALGQQPQHPSVIRSSHRRETRRAQRRDRHREGVVGIVLVGAARTQDPHPGRQRRRHVQHVLAGGHELLGQQIPESAGRLDRPRPLFEGRRPLEQLVELATTRPHLQLRKLCFVAVDHDRGVRPLVGIDTDHHLHCVLLDRVDGPWWALLITVVCVRTSFEPHLGETPASQQLDRKPDGNPTAGT
jgi:hypothetical protein